MSKNNEYLSLAAFISSTREKLNLSQEALAHHSGLDLKTIQSIEQGLDLFLASTVRQKLAKGLKVENKEIKKYEVKTEISPVKKSKMDEIREEILLNSHNQNHKITCPMCGSDLITRIAKLYDLEDNLILRPKARCSKCPFQLTD